jgi:RimJ/RimL family protein N-acetyltransferase
MIKGERITLRAIEREDVPRFLAFNNDIEVELAGGGDPPWPQSLARAMADYERETAKGGRDGNKDGVNFAIEADGIVIGVVGLRDVDPFGRTAELGITIGDKAYWGRGFGREAIRLLLDYAFRMLNLRRVFLRVHGGNERGIRAYRACGFVEEGRLRQHVWSNGAYDDLVFMGVIRDGAG